MSSKSDKDKAKHLQDKCMSVLTGLLRDEDNKYCVDCDSKGPRWASWNIGVFLCIRCAGIHRNLGVHISKVKSVNLDSWTPEQVVSLQQMGNSRARAVYEANLPDQFRRPQNDSALETFIRAKYEHKKYIAREWVQPAVPKVDWEREIDEEIEQQRRRKKQQLSDGAGIKKIVAPSSVAVPPIPKPKAASPKPLPRQPVNNDLDLLGLQQNSSPVAKTTTAATDEGFGQFLSAELTQPTAAEQLSASNNGAVATETDEASFFNQTVPTEKERRKLTKDSILALYATSGNTGTFVQPSQQQQFGGFNAFAQQQQPQQGQWNNALPRQPNQQPQQQVQQGWPQPAMQQFGAMHFPNQQQQQQMAFPQQPNQQTQQQQANLFGLQQQFGNLAMHNGTNNVWH